MISNQLGSPYRYFETKSNGSAWFLIFINLILEQYVQSHKATGMLEGASRFEKGVLEDASGTKTADASDYSHTIASGLKCSKETKVGLKMDLQAHSPNYFAQ